MRKRVFGLLMLVFVGVTGALRGAAVFGAAMTPIYLWDALSERRKAATRTETEPWRYP